MIVYIIIVIAFSFLRNNSLTGKKFYLYFIPLIFGFILLYQMGLISLFSDKIERYYNYRANEITSDSNVLYQAIFRLPILPFGFIGRAILGAFTPLPTALLRIRSIFDDGLSFVQIVVSIGSCWQIINLPFLVFDLKKRDKLSIIYLTIFASIVISTFTFRHFIMVYPLMFILIFRNKSEKTLRQRRFVYLASILSFMLLGIAYLIIS